MVFSKIVVTSYQCETCGKKYGSGKSLICHQKVCECEQPARKKAKVPESVTGRECRFCKEKFEDEDVFFTHRNACRYGREPAEIEAPMSQDEPVSSLATDDVRISEPNEDLDTTDSSQLMVQLFGHESPDMPEPERSAAPRTSTPMKCYPDPPAVPLPEVPPPDSAPAHSRKPEDIPKCKTIPTSTRSAPKETFQSSRPMDNVLPRKFTRITTDIRPGGFKRITKEIWEFGDLTLPLPPFPLSK
jgi:hypothetical protein